jgi:hypothetical protein
MAAEGRWLPSRAKGKIFDTCVDANSVPVNRANMSRPRCGSKKMRGGCPPLVSVWNCLVSNVQVHASGQHPARPLLPALGGPPGVALPQINCFCYSRVIENQGLQTGGTGANAPLLAGVTEVLHWRVRMCAFIEGGSFSEASRHQSQRPPPSCGYAQILRDRDHFQPASP